MMFPIKLEKYLFGQLKTIRIEPFSTRSETYVVILVSSLFIEGITFYVKPIEKIEIKVICMS